MLEPTRSQLLSAESLRRSVLI